MFGKIKEILNFNDDLLKEEEPIIVTDENIQENSSSKNTSASLAAVRARVTGRNIFPGTSESESSDVAAAMASIQEEGVEELAEQNTSRVPNETMMPETLAYVPKARQTAPRTIKPIDVNITPDMKEVDERPEQKADRAHLTEMARMRENLNKENGLSLERISVGKKESDGGEVNSTTEIEETLAAIKSIGENNTISREERKSEALIEEDVVETTSTVVPQSETIQTLPVEEDLTISEIGKVDEPFVIPTTVALETKEVATDNVVAFQQPFEITEVPGVEVHSEIEEGATKASNDNDIKDLNTVKSELSVATERDFQRYFEGSTGNLDEASVKDALTELIFDKVKLTNLVGDARTADGRPLIEIFEGLAASSASKQALASAIKASYNIKSAA